jgi:hypothetical protein
MGGFFDTSVGATNRFYWAVVVGFLILGWLGWEAFPRRLSGPGIFFRRLGNSEDYGAHREGSLCHEWGYGPVGLAAVVAFVRPRAGKVHLRWWRTLRRDGTTTLVVGWRELPR